MPRHRIVLVRPPWTVRPKVAWGLPASRPVGAYANLLQGITLTGGQAQAQIGAGGNAIASCGPQGLGTVWYPAQVTCSTTTGITTGLDTSVCSVYLGAAGTPTTLLGTIFGGNGILAAAVPPLTVGLFIIASWTAGNPGDQAAINIIGTMDALS